jgi:NlpC/P60 family/S-layer homology domain
MRLPLRRLKFSPGAADQRTMAPGGRPSLRRSLRTLATIGAIGAAIALQLSFATPARARASGRYAGGDADLGMRSAVAERIAPLRNLTVARATTVRFSDLDGDDAWAVDAIRYVAATHDWMRDFAPKPNGRYPFHPDATETRKYFARSIVRAFAPNENPQPDIVFTDVDPSTAWYRYAAVAVSHGWMTRTKDGAFLPDKAVTMATVHRALVLALGLRPAAKALNAMHTRNGHHFKLPTSFGTTLLGMRLGLRYNAPTGSEAMDVDPSDVLSRSQVAFSLSRAKLNGPALVPALLDQYKNVRLPFLGPRMLKVVRWGTRFVGYPYVWGGEWGLSRPEPSALGGQPRSGFDCSGFTWWLLRHNDSYAWKVAPPRAYAGWSLPQRTSADMAKMTVHRISWDDLRPGDVMFYDFTGDGVTDHVDTYIGNGYSLDSSSTPGGVTIMWVGTGAYHDHFKFARRIMP